MPSDLIPPATIHSCIDVEELWSRVVGPGEFGGRSLWLGFLDADSTVLPMLAPFDDFPTEPERPLLYDEIARRYSDWPIHLATRDRVQAFAPDDLIVAA